MVKKNTLYIVSTPIGNMDDITLRAIETLKEVDVIVCEEFKPARRLLKRLDIPGKELLSINEHNESSDAQSVIMRMLQNGESMALISDCGTPVFSDPGHNLIRSAVHFQVAVVPVPGASSLMSALSVLDFKMKNFVFGGFLSRNKAERKKEMGRLRNLNMPVVLMDTPYRLKAVLEDSAAVFGKGRKATLGCDMTSHKEKIFRGTLAEILQGVQDRKAEFILIIHDYQRNR